MSRYLDDFISAEHYNLLTLKEYLMNSKCEHNYEKENIYYHDDRVEAICTKCKGKIIIETWN